MSLQTIYWDFDGVLVDSNGAKAEAFFNVVARDGVDFQHLMLKHHEENPGIHRSKKFQYYIDIINPKSSYSLDELLDDFSNYLAGAVDTLSLVEGAESVLSFFRRNNVDMKIVSGAERSEILQILERNQALNYFSSVHGGERSKPEHLMSLGVEPCSAIFIGDSKTDFDAARKFQIPFFLVGKFSFWETWNESVELYPIKYVEELVDLQSCYES